MSSRALFDVLVKILGVYLLTRAALQLPALLAPLSLPEPVPPLWALGWGVSVVIAIGLLVFAPALARFLITEREIQFAFTADELLWVGFGIVGLLMLINGLENFAGMWVVLSDRRNDWYGLGALPFLWAYQPNLLLSALIRTGIGVALLLGRKRWSAVWERLRDFRHSVSHEEPQEADGAFPDLLTSGFQIIWKLDPDEMDSASLVGRLVITDGQEAIDEPSVLIDSWFASLIRACETANSEPTEIEILEHRQRLNVSCDSAGRVHLAFRNREVVVESLKEFKNVLKRRAQDFLSEAARIPGSPDPSQGEIRIFVESSLEDTPDTPEI